MLSVLLSNWIILLLIVATAVVSGLCFFIGYLFSRTSSIELQLRNHYYHITSTIEHLEENVASLARQTNDIRNHIDAFRKELTELIDKQRSEIQ